jgi:hypothetical protein
VNFDDREPVSNQGHGEKDSKQRFKLREVGTVDEDFSLIVSRFGRRTPRRRRRRRRFYLP